MLTAGLLLLAAVTAATPSDTNQERDGGIHAGLLGGVGFPRPLSIEAIVDIDRTVVLGAEYGFMPSITVSGVKTELWAADADLRVFPFRSAFFLGMRAGHQHLSASTTVASIDGEVKTDTWFINPRVGFLWRWKNGLSLGIDAGLQLPLAVSTSTTFPSGAPGVDSATRTADALGSAVLPTIDLLKIGFSI